MIYAQNVIPAHGAFEALQPPLITRFFQIGDVIEGIAPKLTVLTEIIGWDARDGSGIEILVQQKDARVRPNVRAVAADIHGHVPDDRDPAPRKRRAHLRPLPVEDKLLKAIIGVFLARAHFVERLLIAQAVFVLPAPPGQPVHHVLYRHERRVIVQPGAVFLFIFFYLFFFVCARLESLSQNGALGRTAEGIVGDVRLSRIFRGAHVRLRERAVGAQLFRIDIEIIARKSGSARIGRIAQAYRI